MRKPADQQTIDDGKRVLARFLTGPDGEKALAYLRSFTVETFLGFEATEAQLRDLEAKRALVNQLQNLADNSTQLPETPEAKDQDNG